MTRRGKAPQGRAEDEKEEDTVLCLNQSRRLSSGTQQIYIAHGACVVEGRCGAARDGCGGWYHPRALTCERLCTQGHLAGVPSGSLEPRAQCPLRIRRPTLVPPLCKEETPRPQGFFSLASELCPPLLEKSKGTCQVPQRLLFGGFWRKPFSSIWTL